MPHSVPKWQGDLAGIFAWDGEEEGSHRGRGSAISLGIGGIRAGARRPHATLASAPRLTEVRRRNLSTVRYTLLNLGETHETVRQFMRHSGWTVSQAEEMRHSDETVRHMRQMRHSPLYASFMPALCAILIHHANPLILLHIACLKVIQIFHYFPSLTS